MLLQLLCPLPMPVALYGGAALAPITVTSSATFSAAENQTAVATLTATGGTGSYTWTKIGGADTAKFTLTSGGVLTFASAPDFEVPTDADVNNIYIVQVQAADGVSTPATQTVSVTVTDVADVVDTWNPADKSSNISLTAGNLTASATAGGTCAVRSNTSLSTGKVYFEVTATGTIANSGVGLASATANLSTVHGSPAQAAFVNIANANTFVNSGTPGVAGWPGGPGAFVAGDTVCIAVDLVNKRIWYRRNGGIWNNNAANAPSTNTGGIDISAVFASAAAFTLGTFASTTLQHTINFGATTFGQTIPSGFSSWNSAT